MSNYTPLFRTKKKYFNLKISRNYIWQKMSAVKAMDLVWYIKYFLRPYILLSPMLVQTI